MTKLKIVIATSRPFHLHHLARELDRLGCDVEFHSYFPRFRLKRIGVPERAIRSHFAALFPFAGLILLRRNWSWLEWLRDRLAARIDRRIAQRLKPCDVFVGLSSVTIASAQRARELGALVLIERGISHVLQQRDIAVTSGGRVPSNYYVDREIRSYDIADKIVVLSHYSRVSFVAHGIPAECLEITPLGVDLDLFSKPRNPAALPVKALFVGGWTYRKGCDLLNLLLERIPDLELTHVGTSGEVEFPPSPRFRSLGYRSHAELAELMRQHHLLLLPSRDDGFGMVMTEALGCGMRVVGSTASAAPDLAELVGSEYVSVISPGSLDDLEDAVKDQVAAISAQLPTAMPPESATGNLSWSAYGARYLAMITRLKAA